MKLTDVFFDLDHTLWDFDRNSALAFGQIFSHREIGVSVGDFLLHYIPLNKMYWEKYRHDQISQEDLRYRRLRDSFDNLNYEITDELILTISDDYIESLTSYNHLFDGALEVLDYLRPKYNLHIITNGFQSIQERKLVNSGLKPFFDTVTNSEHCGVKKPNRLIFEHALRVSGADASCSVMIGDCLDADVGGALNCGMDAILFSVDDCPAHIKRIKALRELKDFL